MNELRSRPRFAGRTLVAAFAIAALADGVSVFLTVSPPVQVVADLLAGILLFAVLGWHWALLPGLVMEAIPGLAVFPFWILVVAAVAAGGHAKGRASEDQGGAKAEDAQQHRTQERRTEAAHPQPRNEGRRELEHERVDHHQEQPQGEDGDR